MRFVGLGIIIPMNLIGIIGNVLIIIAHVKDPLKLLKSPSSSFILSIAAADGLISATILTLAGGSLLTRGTAWKWNASSFSAVGFRLLTLFTSTLFVSYLGLAIERFLSVNRPLWHRVNVTKRVCRLWTAGIWLAVVGLRGTEFAVIQTVGQEAHSRSILLSFMCLMLILTNSVYLATYVSIKKRSKRVQRRSDMNEATRRAAKKRLQTEKNFLATIVIVCFVLAATSIPFLTLAFMQVNDTLETLRQDAKLERKISLSLLICFNSAVNVFVYIWRLPKYRKTFIKLYLNR